MARALTRQASRRRGVRRDVLLRTALRAAAARRSLRRRRARARAADPARRDWATTTSDANGGDPPWRPGEYAALVDAAVGGLRPPVPPRDVLAAIGAAVANRESKARVIEKTPQHVHWLPRVAASFPRRASSSRCAIRTTTWPRTSDSGGDSTGGSRRVLDLSWRHPLIAALFWRSYSTSIERALTRYPQPDAARPNRGRAGPAGRGAGRRRSRSWVCRRPDLSGVAGPELELPRGRVAGLARHRRPLDEPRGRTGHAQERVRAAEAEGHGPRRRRLDRHRPAEPRCDGRPHPDDDARVVRRLSTALEQALDRPHVDLVRDDHPAARRPEYGRAACSHRRGSRP